MSVNPLRTSVDFHCGVDGERLRLVKGKYSLYWQCPKADIANREIDEPRCTNYLAPRDCNYIYTELELLAEAGKLHEGYSGQIFHLQYSIERVKENYIKIFVYNNKSNLSRRNRRSWYRADDI